LPFKANSELVEHVIEHLRKNGGSASALEICSDVFGLVNCDHALATTLISQGMVADDRILVEAGGQVRLAPARADNRLLAELSFAVIDLETTGIAPPDHRLTEAAAVIVEGGKLLDDFSTLINPGVAIPRRIVSMTGITNQMVRDAPVLHEVAPAIVRFLADRVLVAHNSTFDVNFLNAELGRVMDIKLTNWSLCTVRLSRALVPGLESYRLAALADYFGIEITNHHRALADATATAKIFLRLLDVASQRGWRRLSQLLRVAGTQNSPKLNNRNKDTEQNRASDSNGH